MYESVSFFRDYSGKGLIYPMIRVQISIYCFQSRIWSTEANTDPLNAYHTNLRNKQTPLEAAKEEPGNQGKERDAMYINHDTEYAF